MNLKLDSMKQPFEKILKHKEMINGVFHVILV